MENVSILYLALPLLAILFLFFSLYYYARRKKLAEEGEEKEPAQPAQPAGPSLKSRIFGAGGSLLYLAIGAIIVLAILWPFIGPADQTFASEDLKKLEKVSGTSQFSGNTLTVNGKIAINGSEIKHLKKVVVTFYETPKNLKVCSGFYCFDYDQKIELRQSLFGIVQEKIHTGQIYYNGISITHTDTGELKSNSEPREFKMEKELGYRLNPAVYLDGKFLVEGNRLETLTPEPIKGKISISSSSNMRIVEVKVWYDSLGEIKSKLGIG